MPALALPPLKGSASKYDATVLPAGVPNFRGSAPRAIKCLVVWAALMTLLCAATGGVLWILWDEMQALKAGQLDMSATRSDLETVTQMIADLQESSIRKNRTADYALRSAVSAANADGDFQAQMVQAMDQLRQEVQSALEQRRLQRLSALVCQPGEEPDGTGGCAGCEPHTYS
eukprot:SAG31_NODE_15003_length_776_cov_1.002954_2_plen_172_part_01